MSPTSILLFAKLTVEMFPVDNCTLLSWYVMAAKSLLFVHQKKKKKGGGLPSVAPMGTPTK
jgi:hypothetical protein